MGWSAMIALGMAYVVAIEMLLMGVIVGMQAAAMPVGPATILCTPSGEQPPSSSPERGHIPACCVLGCGMSGQGMAPPPALSAVIGRDPSAMTRVLTWVPDAPPHAHPRMAGHARAPPRQG
ncbi:DUF2946 family protein [Chelatococcus asaccharovorans]|uniref:DUF2946 family protein n=1 Tax=Chelatococcus asaccharovorans TaxID=28210 RepID=UPI00224C76B4|nr:hypothetical protein [Chelatococcus asaccharovorans]CAH1662283.1 conserved hypothetical protein [Chelatococcus asaccharovorans]CAH1683217.1 conserved hypothetical protein [Chelatococcus asaccharovorans]